MSTRSQTHAFVELKIRVAWPLRDPTQGEPTTFDHDGRVSERLMSWQVRRWTKSRIKNVVITSRQRQWEPWGP